LNKSENINELAKALIAAQAEFPEIQRTKEVVVTGQRGSYVFKYAPMEKTLPVIRPVLAKHGLTFIQGGAGEQLVSLLMHTSGQWVSFSMPLLDQAVPQQYGSHFSFKRRYAMDGILGIKSDDADDDQAFKSDGKKSRVTPNADAFDNVDKDRHNWIHQRAATIVDYWNAGDPDEAYRAYKEVTEQAEILAVWSFLDSKMRREFKTRDAKANGSK
jgi:hypothetical protein